MSSIHPINPPKSTAQRIIPIRRLRFWLIAGFFTVWVLIIAGRLFQLQILRHAEFEEKAQKQQLRTFEVAPRRGILYDRNLRELAMTVQVDSIYADPSAIEDKKTVAHQLSEIVHTDPEDTHTTESELGERLENGQHFAWIARRVTADQASRVRDLIAKNNLKGIYFQKEFQRFYPDQEIAAQVLGYVGLDDNGLGGVEQKFESQLHGAPGRMYAAWDAKHHISGSTAKDPEPGRNLVLTIDENIQFKVEQILDRAMAAEQADSGTVVVQDVHTGEILALAIRPTFNPNQFRHTTQELLKNHAVSDVYEPGSAFKLLTYSAAIDVGVVKPDDEIDCQGSQITVAGRVIHDDKGDHFGVIPVHKALEESSNVGAIKVAMKLGNEKFYEYIRNFGFGTRSGIELPGETRGLLEPVKKWSGSSIASIAMGQEVGVTPVQLVSMVSTIANGGVYLPPHIMMPDQPATGQTPAAQPRVLVGEDLPNPLPAGSHRVISTLSAAQMRKMMEGVILYGTGKQAQLNGYSSGGKTGTAQKIDPHTHTYSKTAHIATFVGFAPVNNPVIAVAVVMDSPRKVDYHAAHAAAPVFTEVSQSVLEYLAVPHDTPLKKSTAKPAPTKSAEEDTSDASDPNALFAAANELPDDDPLRQTVAAAPQQQTTTSKPAANATPPPADKNARKAKAPNLVGLEVRKALETATNAGFNLHIIGNGKVTKQKPAAGVLIPTGSQIIVQCGR
jgi:cell division protein FtsI (penicillin-binding protein 3)